jgi:hypothetical protein
MKGLGLVFFSCLVFSVVGTATISSQVKSAPGTTLDSQQASQSNIPSLPDTDSTWLSTLLSAIGGFGGGGILLIFLVRRFISGYDETMKKWEEKFDKITEKYDQTISQMWDKWSEKYEKLSTHYDAIIDDIMTKIEQRNEKLMCGMEETKDAMQEVRFELAKFKEISVTKDSCFSNSSARGAELARLKEKVDSLEKKFRLGNG